MSNRLAADVVQNRTYASLEVPNCD